MSAISFVFLALFKHVIGNLAYIINGNIGD